MKYEQSWENEIQSSVTIYTCKHVNYGSIESLKMLSQLQYSERQTFLKIDTSVLFHSQLFNWFSWSCKSVFQWNKNETWQIPKWLKLNRGPPLCNWILSSLLDFLCIQVLDAFLGQKERRIDFWFFFFIKISETFSVWHLQTNQEW